MVKTELYFNIETKEWMLKNKSTGYEQELKYLVEEHERDNVEIEFTGFKGKQEKVKETLNLIEVNTVSRVKGFKVVTGSEAVNSIYKEGKLWFPDLEKFLTCEMHGQELKLMITYINSMNMHFDAKGWTLEKIAQNQWLVKE
ncbi:hypothetical protein ACQUY5_30230 [Bacillus cereus]|uniref:hypothetical protein n=1 Tax=Bacillus cereus TaxID=1396 RepID=UPI003D183AC9